jgi:NAD(P)-dependent dehydrogenase (short-subunit alcohol dehydrogenase family)
MRVAVKEKSENASTPPLPNSPDARCKGGCCGGCHGAETQSSPDAEDSVASEMEAPVALVTGGAVRIGAAICRQLCMAGYNLIVHYRESRDAAEALRDELVTLGAACELMPCDLARSDQVEAFVKRCWSVFGSINLVVNNASVFARHDLLESEVEDFELQWRVNALAPMLVTKAFASLCRQHDDPAVDRCVINLLDRRVATHEPGCIPYLMSKKVLDAFCSSAALELGPHVRINAVAPGPILPPPGGTISEAAGRTVLNAPCTPQNIASAVYYLSQASCVTGQRLFIDAGQHLCSIGVEDKLR